MKRLLLSLLVGLVLMAGVSFVKFTYVDRPAFQAGLQECFKDPLCDPSPYTSIGFPWAYGNYDDSSGTLRILTFHSRPGDYEGATYGRDYFGITADVVVFSGITFAAMFLISRKKKTS